MGNQLLKYHQNLAEYFNRKPLYLDEPTQKKPNTRKLVEQPWQLTKAEMWDGLVKTLTAIEFIEAKNSALMLHDLVLDYFRAEQVWPDLEEDRRKDRERQQYIKEYVEKLVSYSRAHTQHEKDQTSNIPPLPMPPISVIRINNREKPAKQNGWTPLERLRSFGNFVSNHMQPLEQRIAPVFQLAYNSADSGPVTEGADTLLLNGKNPQGLWLKSRLRPPINEHPDCLTTLAAGKYWVNAVYISPDGKKAISSADYGFLRIWNLESGISRKLILKNILTGVNDLSVTPDGLMAVIGSHFSLYLLNLETGESREFKGHTGAINAVAITTDGHYAVSGSNDKSVRFWNLETGESEVLNGHTQDVNAVAITPDGCFAVSGSSDKTIRVWNLKTGVSRLFQNGSNWDIVSIDISIDGQFAVSGSYNEICVWNLKTGKSQIFSGSTKRVKSVKITPDGRHAVSGCQERSLHVWDLETGKNRILTGHTEDILCLSITPDGHYAISGSVDKTIRIWDLENGQSRILPYHTDSIVAVCLTHNRRNAITGSKDKTLSKWDLETGENHTIPGQTSDVNTVAFSPVGQYAISGSSGSSISLPVQFGDSISIWNLESGKNRCLSGHSLLVNTIAITPDGRQAVTGSWDKTLRVWDIESGESKVFSGHNTSVNIVIITPDGSRAISGSFHNSILVLNPEMSQNNDIRVWNIDNGEYQVIASSLDSVEALAVTPDGHCIIAGCEWNYRGYNPVMNPGNTLKNWSKNNSLRMWNLFTGKNHIFSGHVASVRTVIATPDGRFVVSGSDDCTIRIWDLISGGCRVLYGHYEPVNVLTVTSDGRYIISGSVDKTICIWDFKTGKCISSHFSSGGEILCIAQKYPFILAGTKSGWFEILHLERAPSIGPNITTAVKLWLSPQGKSVSRWDDKYTAICESCGQRITVPNSILDAITTITQKANLKLKDSPCLNLPNEAWDEPSLLSECPLCHHQLKFNPFSVDLNDGLELNIENETITSSNVETYSSKGNTMDDLHQTFKTKYQDQRNEISKREEIIRSADDLDQTLKTISQDQRSESSKHEKIIDGTAKVTQNDEKIDRNTQQNTCIDIGGKSYKTVKIGEQFWMAENLNVERFRNGDIIHEAKSEAEWKKAIMLNEPAWCFYDNDSENGKKYGKLYNWHSVNDKRGLAPEGWHIPTNVEFEILVASVNNNGSALRAIGQEIWDEPLTNTSGFSAMLAGYRGFGGLCNYLGFNAYFWSSKENGEYGADSMCLLYNGSGNGCFSDIKMPHYGSKSEGFSVRCVKD